MMLSNKYNIGRQMMNSIMKSVFCRHGSSIKIILLSDLERKGSKGEIIKVKRGFARNYLIPKKIAAYATDANKLKYAQLFEAVPDLSREKLLSLKDTVLRFERASTVGGALFGSVSVADIKSFFSERGLDVDKIDLESGLKSLGDYTVKVDDVDFQIQIVEPPSVAKTV